MIVGRRNGSVEVCTASPDVVVKGNGKTLVVGTMQLLTKLDGAFEEPLGGDAINGGIWRGKIVDAPDTQLPIQVDGFVWIEVTAGQPDPSECLIVKIDAQGNASLDNGGPAHILWQATGSSDSHAYSLRPMSLRIAACRKANFTAQTPGANPERENEGGLARFGGNGLDQFGIVVDVDGDTGDGFAVALSSILTKAKALLGIP